MSDHNHIIKATNGRSRILRKIILSIAPLLGAGAMVIGGTLAIFTNAVMAGPQTITSGTVKLAVGPANDAATGAANLVAGDTISREADLTGASRANRETTVKFLATRSSLLDTDPANGLQLSVQACSSAWTRTVVDSPPPPYTYACGAGATVVRINGAATASVSSLKARAGVLTPLNSLVARGKDFLVFTLTLPLGAPGDLSRVPACSGVSGGTVANEDMQGCSSSYSLQVTQRNAIVQ